MTPLPGYPRLARPWRDSAGWWLVVDVAYCPHEPGERIVGSRDAEAPEPEFPLFPRMR